MRNVSKIGGVSMNRKERAWQGSKASLSILTREPAVVELFKILKSNRLSPCKCHFKLPLYFPRNSSSLPPSPSLSFANRKPLCSILREFFLWISPRKFLPFFFFFFFPSLSGNREILRRIDETFFLWTMKIHRPFVYIFSFLLGYVVSTTSRSC